MSKQEYYKNGWPKVNLDLLSNGWLGTGPASNEALATAGAVPVNPNNVEGPKHVNAAEKAQNPEFVGGTK